MHLIADRKGNIQKENSMQDRLLEGLYRHRAGRILLKLLVSPGISKLGGKLLDTRASSLLIPFFIRHYAVDMTEFEVRDYLSYNDFFTRKLAVGARDIVWDHSVLICPCDSRLSVYKIKDGCEIFVKNTRYTVEGLLKNHRLAAKYTGGYLWIFRLCIEDYHRYVYVDNGIVSKNYRIPGVFHTVNPIANDYFPIYKENTREYCLLKSENFGTLLQMEVGALFVGKIENRPGEKRVQKGEEKGNFAFGGSTLILMTQKGRVLPNGDILRYSKAGIETKVRLGEQIGIGKQVTTEKMKKNINKK